MGVYKWKASARFKADPQIVGEELSSIGTLRPGDVVEFAENEATELHKCFTWDDAKAAHFYRMEEARSVVAAVITIDEAPDRTPVEYRAFESVIVDGERQYMPTKTILNNKDMRAQVLGEIGAAIGELATKAKTYRYLAETELDKAQQHLEMAREAVTV